MNALLAVMVGGSLGALARYGVDALVHVWFPRSFPFGTLLINVSGSLAIGIFYVLILERLQLHGMWRHVVMVGFLGAFTTFSTFSLETVRLLEQGQIVMAMSYTLLSVGLCLLATWVGLTMMRSL